MPNGIEDQLKTLPGKIKEKALILYKQEKKLLELELEQKLIKSGVERDVENARDKEDKKTYPNPLTRKAEERRRLGNSVRYGELKKDIETLKDDIKEGDIHLGYMKRLFRSAEARAYLERPDGSR